MPITRLQYTASEHRLVFIDGSARRKAIVNGHTNCTFDRFLTTPARIRSALPAVASTQVRANLEFRCVQSHTAPNDLLMDDVHIGNGALISPFVTITSNIHIGKCFHTNIYSYVEHDCMIGNFVTFGPGVQCNVNVTIGDYAYIGAGAVIRQGLSIGVNATMGMGAVVTKEVPGGVTVAGNPARLMERI